MLFEIVVEFSVGTFKFYSLRMLYVASIDSLAHSFRARRRCPISDHCITFNWNFKLIYLHQSLLDIPQFLVITAIFYMEHPLWFINHKDLKEYSIGCDWKFF